MRLRIEGSVVTIPDKLIKKLDRLDIETANAINTLLKKGEKIISEQHLKNANIATKAKVSKTKEKIQNAINLLKLQGEPVNPYRVAKLSGVAYNTAYKYLKNANFKIN